MCCHTLQQLSMFLSKSEVSLLRKMRENTSYQDTTYSSRLSPEETSCLLWFSLKITQSVHLHSYQLFVL